MGSGSDISSSEVVDLARFFLQSKQIQGDQAVISGNDAHHITRVLRLRVGDEVEGVDPSGEVYCLRLDEVGDVVRATIIQAVGYSQESPLKITLFQGLAKGDKMDLVIQKAVELGASEIVPFISRYTVVKLEPKQAKKRQERWERIALEAAKQSRRTRIPIVGGLHAFSALLESVKERGALGDLVILAYEGETKMGIGDLDDPAQGVSVIVGPEGGFTPEEVKALELAGAQVCTLGPRILRTETAGLVLLSILGYKWGDLK